MILILSLTISLLTFPRPEGYNRSLLLGDVAPHDVRAPQDLLVQDPAATAGKRQAARALTPPVFDLDDQAAAKVKERVHQLFARGRAIVNGQPAGDPDLVPPASGDASIDDQLDKLRRSFNAALGFNQDDGVFDAFLKTGFSVRAEQAVSRLVTDLFRQGIVADKSVLWDNADKGIIVRHLYSQVENPTPYVAVYPSLEEARRLVEQRALLFGNDFDRDVFHAIVSSAKSLLRPNLVFNSHETELRRDQAAAEVSPVYFPVKNGEIIVREGEQVDETARMKLEALAGRTEKSWLPHVAGYFLLTLVFVVVTAAVGFGFVRGLKLRDRDLIFLAALLWLNVVLAWAASQVGDAMHYGWPGVNRHTILYVAPMAAWCMLATVFLGSQVGLFFAVVASALSALVAHGDLTLFFYFFLGAIVGLAGLHRVRERSMVIRAGLLVGVVNAGSIAAIGLVDASTWANGPAFSLLAGLISGVLAGVLVVGLIPLFEMLFRYTTTIKLMELANLDQPVLRDLMVQAPGTYHHSVIVGALVEAAAEAIGANPLLAKVSAYYHDLGKMKKPLYFVENQGYGVNKHEKLAPSMSSLILISHVKDGVELARKHKLSREIIDIIQQHHGTSLIAYFYHKAQNCRNTAQPEINIEDYRYPGPKPQTREAGLVMLADAVEAASRSLVEPNPARIQGLVQKIMNNIFSDGQLDECELTLKDLHSIARSFNKILSGIFHRRIAYPERAPRDAVFKKQAENGHQPDKPTKPDPHRPKSDDVEGPSNLRRLGLS